jgi:hypothetical protein
MQESKKDEEQKKYMCEEEEREKRPNVTEMKKRPKGLCSTSLGPLVSFYQVLFIFLDH